MDADTSSNMPFGPKVFINVRSHTRTYVLAVVSVLCSAAALGLWFYNHNTYHYGLVTLSNGGYAYSFQYTKGAITEALNGTSYKQGYSLQNNIPISVVAKPTNDLALQKCDDLGSGWKFYSFIQQNNATYPVCTDNGLIFSTVFPSGDQNQLLEIISRNNKTAINSETVNTILSSLIVKKS